MRITEILKEAIDTLDNAISKMIQGYKHGRTPISNTCYAYVGEKLRELNTKNATMRLWGLKATDKNSAKIVHGDAVLPSGEIISTIPPENYERYGYQLVDTLDVKQILDKVSNMTNEAWSKKYKKSIDCSSPKGFSQKAHCAGRKARQAGKKTKSTSINEDFEVGTILDLTPNFQNYEKLYAIVLGHNIKKKLTYVRPIIADLIPGKKPSDAVQSSIDNVNGFFPLKTQFIKKVKVVPREMNEDGLDQDWRDLHKLDPFKQEYKPDVEWPPNDEQLKQIERRILQDPEWLAYYKRFGWDSWTSIPKSHYYYDKHNKTISYYDVPSVTSEWNVNKPKGLRPDRTLLKIDLNGNIMSGSDKYQVILPRALEQIKAHIKSIFTPQNLRYMSGRYYIRFGRWRDEERSQNYLASREQGKPVYEPGVSAYHADYVPEEDRWAIDESMNYDTITGTLAALLYNPNKRIFLVQGTEIDEEGADGEPLLHNVKLVKELKVTDVYMPGVYDPREEDIRENTTIQLRGFGPSEKSKEFVAKINSMYPQSPLNRNNRVKIYGQGNDMQIVQFELVPKQKDKVEIKWIQATPMGSGAGSKFLQELQKLAKQDGITLTLFAWDKGIVSQPKLIRFYKKHGFDQIGKTGNMEYKADDNIN